jgi:hypothetical protein
MIKKTIEIRKWSTHHNVLIRNGSSLRVRVASSTSHLNRILKEEGTCETRWINECILVD